MLSLTIFPSFPFKGFWRIFQDSNYLSGTNLSFFLSSESLQFFTFSFSSESSMSLSHSPLFSSCSSMNLSLHKWSFQFSSFLTFHGNSNPLSLLEWLLSRRVTTRDFRFTSYEWPDTYPYLLTKCPFQLEVQKKI